MNPLISSLCTHSPKSAGVQRTLEAQRSLLESGGAHSSSVQSLIDNSSLTLACSLHLTTFILFRSLSSLIISNLLSFFSHSLHSLSSIYSLLPTLFHSLLLCLTRYAAFLNATQGNAVLNFPVKGGFGYFMDAIRLLLAISLVTSYPLTLWECRSHLEQMIQGPKDTEVCWFPPPLFFFDTPTARGSLRQCVIVIVAVRLTHSDEEEKTAE
jgi:hypothetical protein